MSTSSKSALWLLFLLGNIWPFVVMNLAVFLIVLSRNADFWPDSVASPMFYAAFAGILIMPYPLFRLLSSNRGRGVRLSLAMLISLTLGILEVFLAMNLLMVIVRFAFKK